MSNLGLDKGHYISALYPVSVRRLLGFATPLPPPVTIADAGLRFATLGGKYLWRDFHPQELCRARHTTKQARP